MSDQRGVDEDIGEERLFSWRRIKVLVLGSVAAIVIGLVAVSFYTGGSPFEILFGKQRVESPDLGKQAYTKGTDFFIGIIKGEGVTPKRVKVYYIEQAGGQMIEVAKERVEVRESNKSK